MSCEEVISTAAYKKSFLFFFFYFGAIERYTKLYCYTKIEVYIPHTPLKKEGETNIYTDYALHLTLQAFSLSFLSQNTCLEYH